MQLIISIAMITVLGLSALIVILRPQLRLEGKLPLGVISFAAIFFSSGLDVGLIMFPLTEFPTYAVEPEYGFINPLAMAFGAWGFLVWGLYFLTTFYFCAIEPHVKIFEIKAVKYLYNVIIIATCAFTGFLFFKYLPDYIINISEPLRYVLVAGVVLLAIISSLHVKYIRWLSLGSFSLFMLLAFGLYIYSDMGLSGFYNNLKLLTDYIPNMHRFVTPISEYHQFYLYWWMAWSLMIGQFVARFVGGLTLWQLLATLLVMPSVTIAFWFIVLFYFYQNAIVITPAINAAMVGVGILFVINSLDSLTRLYTDNLGFTHARFGRLKYVAINWSLLFALILLYRHTELKIEWVGLLVIGLYGFIIVRLLLYWLQNPRLKMQISQALNVEN